MHRFSALYIQRILAGNLHNGSCEFIISLDSACCTSAFHLTTPQDTQVCSMRANCEQNLLIYHFLHQGCRRQKSKQKETIPSNVSGQLAVKSDRNNGCQSRSVRTRTNRMNMALWSTVRELRHPYYRYSSSLHRMFKAFCIKISTELVFSMCITIDMFFLGVSGKTIYKSICIDQFIMNLNLVLTVASSLLSTNYPAAEHGHD